MRYIKRILAAVLLFSILTLSFSACGKNKDPLKKYEEDTDTATKDFYYVAMSIEDYGVIIVKLDYNNTPITVQNFVKLVREGFYDGLTFHRVINNFMIQGGDPKGNGTGGSSATIKGEFLNNGHYNAIPHKRGVISMARSNSYNSASSQFFICNASSASVTNLDGNYAAFGYVVEGIEVVDAITANTAAYGLYNNGMISNASNRAVITKMKVIKYTETD